MNKNIIYERLRLNLKHRSKALATLTIYLTNPVGIGEHPQHIEEMETIARSLAEADDVLETLKRTFEPAEPSTENE